MKKIAFIVVNYKTHDFTIDCVNSILKNCGISFDIFVVDNCSPNNSFQVLSNAFFGNENVKVIKTDCNKGYSYGLNYGVGEAGLENYEYIAFCNNDLIINKGVVELVLSAFDDRDDVGVAGGQIVGPDGLRQRSYKYILTYKKHLMSMKPFRFFTKDAEEKDGYSFDRPLFFEGMVCGCFFIIPTVVLKEVGLLDDFVFIYFEEDILAIKMKNAGYKTALIPNAKIVHVGSQTITPSAFTYFNRYKSSLYVLKKYCKASKRQLWNVYMLYKISFLLKLHRRGDYIRYYKDLKEFYKDSAGGRIS